MSFTVLLNMLSAILLVAVFALIKKQAALKQDILRIQKEWVQWRATTTPQPEITVIEDTAVETLMQQSEGPYVSEHLVKEPLIDQSIRSRGHFGDDWRPSGGGIREKAAKSLKSETLGAHQQGDRFSKARELLRQGHGMKEVAVVTGLSYSELALISKTESTL